MNNKEKLEKEKDKLNRLVGEALENGYLITQNDTIITQSRKVDALIVEVQREEIRHTRKQQER